MNTISLYYDSLNDYKELLRESESYFNVKYHIVSPLNANAINYENKYLLDFSPNKIELFLTLHTTNEDRKVISEKINKFIKEKFNKQTIVIRIDDNVSNKLLFDDIKENVNIIYYKGVG